MARESDTGDTKLDLRIQRTYKLLKEALIDLLKTKSFDQITVQELCERAMVRRTTFYQHFEDKHDFLNWFLRDKQREFMTETLQGSENREDIEACLVRILTRILHYLKQNKDIIESLSHSSVKNRSPLSELADIFAVQLSGFMDAFLEEHHMTSELPTRLAAEYYIGAISASARWWLKEDCPIPEEKLVEYLGMLNGSIPIRDRFILHEEETGK